MRKSRYLTLLFGILAIAGLSDCSRESSVKEDVSLKNNHSRVFAQREAFEDPKAFADSMANTAFNQADSLADTLTVTVNDTVYLMGILPRNVDKIYRFQWNLTKADGKDTTILGNNATPMAWAYANAGVYYPQFIAFDGNNASDTAGTDTKRTYINVIDTKPTLWVPKDTLWTSNKGTITFPIVTSDSFGTITKVLVDLDASGKDSAKVWNYETRSKNDSLYLTIKNEPSYIDSLGNQKIYVIVVDDDNNETKDSVNLHFNRLPKLKVLYPLDGDRHNAAEPFAFYYEGSDEDNPEDLRYFIYAQNGKNGQPPTKAFDSEDLIAENVVTSICNFWVEDDGAPRNVIALVNNPNKELNGRIYWDMYVTDGYDVVHMSRIDNGDGTSRPWNFYIGDVTTEMGSVSGVATYQGRTDYSGINVELTNGIKTYVGVTDAKGNYTIKVGAGVYTATAYSIVSEYTEDTQTEVTVESGERVSIDSLFLKDTVAPLLVVKSIDTIDVRNIKQNIYARDLGARLDSLIVTLDGKKQDMNCNTTDQNAIFNCQLIIEDLLDGAHYFVYTAKDKAGNSTVVKDTFHVDATTLSLLVDGGQKQLVGPDNSMTFEVTIENAYPTPDSVTWSYIIGTDTKVARTKVTDGKSTLALSYDDIKDKASPKTDYYMVVTYAENNVNLKDTVTFGILDNNPAVIFTAPATKVQVTKNDPMEFKIAAYRGADSDELNIHWECGSNLSTGSTCPKDSTIAVSSTTNKIEITKTLAFKAFGTQKISVSVTDQTGASSKTSDEVAVEIISDKPSIKASSKDNQTEFKINSTAEVSLDAKDKFGTVNKISWGCSNGTVAYDNTTTLTEPKQSISDFKIQIKLPGEPTNKYKCLFKAIDDDDEEGLDSLTFTTLLDPPTVSLGVKRDTVKINSIQTIKAKATDKLGTIEKYEVACEDDLKDLASPSWETMNGNTVEVTMPPTAMSYYCVVQVTDDDNNTARDTAVYVTLVGNPTITVSQVDAYKTVTILDTIVLQGIASDSLGNLVKYAWGCGVLPASLGYTTVNITPPAAKYFPNVKVAMPSVAHNKYSCILQIIDDDGNTASDTIDTKVILAPPTVQVKNEKVTVRPNYNIALSAEASDNNGVVSDPGEIVKREWSCGTPSNVDKNWQVVSSYDTVWKAPSTTQVLYYCIARATDNDGTSVTDTMQVEFTDVQPIIQVFQDTINIHAGTSFTLSANVNEAWQGIDWFQWNCVDKSSQKSLEPNGTLSNGTPQKWDYNKNGGNMTITKGTAYSENSKDMYCIISAQETSTKATFTDTTVVHVLQVLPQAFISAADTVYLWSGDDNVNDEAKYYYTKEWGGMESKIGELGDPNDKVYYWRFSGADDGYYLGESDGSIDTSSQQFNSAFARKTIESSITFTLDFRDKSTETPTAAFYSLHRAAEVSRTIYFRKAWNNLMGKDTVVENVGIQNTPPSLTLLKDEPYEAYTTKAKTVKVAKIGNETKTFVNTDQISVTDSITQIELVNDKTNLYLGVLDKANNYKVYKSASGSSAFAQVGGTIENVTSPKLLCNSASPIVIYIKGSDSQPYLAKFNNSWSSTAVAQKEGTNFREITATIVPDNGNIVIVAVDATTEYNAYYSVYSSSYTAQKSPSMIAQNMSKISLAANSSKIYLGFSNRDVNQYGPYVYEGTINSNNINWTTGGDLYGKPIFEGFFAAHMNVAVYGDVVYATLDDKSKATAAQVHVFKLVNGKWHFFGENQLPYFSSIFYNRDNHYYNLRGSSPQLAIDGNGKVYLSMLARESGAKAPNKFNGPIVMKYVADNWEVHK